MVVFIVKNASEVIAVYVSEQNAKRHVENILKWFPNADVYYICVEISDFGKVGD